EKRAIAAAEDLHVRSASGACRRDDIHLAVVIEVARGNINAAREAVIISQNLADETAIGPAINANVGAAARARGGNNVRLATAIHIASGNPNASKEARVISHEAKKERLVLAAKDLHMRAPSVIRARDDVGIAVPVHIGGRHGDSTAEERAVGHEL